MKRADNQQRVSLMVSELLPMSTFYPKGVDDAEEAAAKLMSVIPENHINVN